MDIPPDILQLGLQLAESVARNGASAISAKIRALRQGGKDQDTIDGLEQIISDLIADKNEITRIAQSYEQELVSQRMTDKDVSYVTDSVVPLLESFASAMDDAEAGQKLKAQISTLKPVLSVEMINIMQILGFNFRQAIGEPLTRLVEGLILANVPKPTADATAEAVKLQREAMLLAQDADAYARFREMFPAA